MKVRRSHLPFFQGRDFLTPPPTPHRQRQWWFPLVQTRTFDVVALCIVSLLALGYLHDVICLHVLKDSVSMPTVTWFKSPMLLNFGFFMLQRCLYVLFGEIGVTAFVLLNVPLMQRMLWDPDMTHDGILGRQLSIMGLHFFGGAYVYLYANRTDVPVFGWRSWNLIPSASVYQRIRRGILVALMLHFVVATLLIFRCHIQHTLPEFLSGCAGLHTQWTLVHLLFSGFFPLTLTVLLYNGELAEDRERQRQQMSKTE